MDYDGQALMRRMDVCKKALEAVKPVTLAFFRGNIDIDIKADLSPVTEADRNTETGLKEVLIGHFPNDGFFGEETGRSGGGEWQWIIDPIDGTRAFIHGNPLFGTLVGLLYQGKPVMSACTMPAMNDVWLAVLGDKPTRNNQPIKTASTQTLALASLATTSPDFLPEDFMPAFEALKRQVLRTQYGGDCFNYLALASGWCDIVLDIGLQPYDILPMVTLIESAGGMVTDIHGKPLAPDNYQSALAAATPELHSEALEIVRMKYM